MKCARVFFDKDGKVVTLAGIKVRTWTPKWTHVGGKKQDVVPTRYSCRFGLPGVMAFLETKEGNAPEVVTKPPHKEGGEAPNFVYEMSLEEVKTRAGNPFFVMTRATGGDKDKILLLIDTKNVDIEGKNGDIVASNSHLDGLPCVCAKGEKSSYLVAMTVVTVGKTITLTPQGGPPILLRYDGGMRFSTRPAPFAKAIATATVEGETQKKAAKASTVSPAAQ